MYINCHSCFSLGYGTMQVTELVAEAKTAGIETLALTDINNTSASMNFYRACSKAGIKPVIGIEFRDKRKLLYLGIARNNEGFAELNRFLSNHSMEKIPLPEIPPAFENVYIVYKWENKPDRELEEYEYIGIHYTQLGQLFSSPYKKKQNKLLVWKSFTFKNSAGKSLNKLLVAIHNNLLLTRLTEQDYAGGDEYMIAPTRIRALYSDYPAILKNTEELLNSCDFSPDMESPKNKNTFTENKADDYKLLRKLSLEGMGNRYPNASLTVKQRLAKELEVILRLGFCAYFLITWDFVRYARSRSFFHVGRGSGANSIVAYCLGITDVDPIELDLYFERFLNPHRTSPPDFDIDFSWKDRDEVIDYIFKRYGSEYTAMLATYITYKGRSTFRELGKVFGLPKSEIDTLVFYRKNENYMPDHITNMIRRYGKMMEGLPRHLSVHPGGVIISNKPITTYTATHLPPKGFITTDIDMVVAEDVGLYKYDVLSQRGLGHIKECSDIVHKTRGEKIKIHNVSEFKKDPKIRDMIRQGKTIGCFYVESPAMRQLLQKMKCESYLELVAASSIIRPGVARSGMMRTFISRHRNPNDFEYLHPKMADLLEETYGVMVYQEDVIKVAHHFGGLEPAEGDILRRVMSGKKYPGDMIRNIKDNFFKNCAEKEYPIDIVEEVWRQIESFSGYSFSKAHSASYAVESYQSLFLKTYYPIEFMVSVINNFGGFYSTEVYFHEARMAGATIHPPCINHSEYKTRNSGTDIWVGFIHVQQLEKRLGKLIAKVRNEHGPFASLEDFIRRIQPGREQIIILIRIGALEFSGFSRKQLLWKAQMHYSGKELPVQATVLFSPPEMDYALPPLPDHWLEAAYDEIELLGFPLCSPFKLVDIPERRYVAANDMKNNANKTVLMIGYLITTKGVRTVNGKQMYFGNFFDEKGKHFDTIHFPPSVQKSPFIGGGVYILRGKITLDFDVPALEVDQMIRLKLLKDPRRTD